MFLSFCGLEGMGDLLSVGVDFRWKGLFKVMGEGRVCGYR